MLVAKIRKMRTLNLTILLFTILLSCKPQTKFEKAKWIREPYSSKPEFDRESMVKDLMPKLVGLKKQEVLNLLGLPEGDGDSVLLYEVSVEFKKDVSGPIGGKYLDIYFTPDSIVRSTIIRDWKKENY